MRRQLLRSVLSITSRSRSSSGRRLHKPLMTYLERSLMSPSLRRHARSHVRCQLTNRSSVLTALNATALRTSYISRTTSLSKVS